MFHRTIALHRAQTGTVLHNRCDTAPCSQTPVTSKHVAPLTRGHTYTSVIFLFSIFKCNIYVIIIISNF